MGAHPRRVVSHGILELLGRTLQDLTELATFCEKEGEVYRADPKHVPDINRLSKRLLTELSLMRYRLAKPEEGEHGHR